MRFETWQIDDKIITIKKEKRLILTFNDDGTDSYLSYIGYFQDESVSVPLDLYDELDSVENAKMLTWFDLPDEDDEEYE